jgi:hypothetical protein
MNERIKFLLLEASAYALTMNPDEDSYGHPVNLAKYHLDRDTKFAELIVKECAEVGLDSVEDGDDLDAIMKRVHNNILKHFGVK